MTSIDASLGSDILQDLNHTMERLQDVEAQLRRVASGDVGDPFILSGATAGTDVSGTYPSNLIVDGELGATVSVDGPFTQAGGLMTDPVDIPAAPVAGSQKMKRRYIRSGGTTPAGGTGAKRLRLFWINRDALNWQSGAPIIVEVYTAYYSGGGYTRSVVSGGYNDPLQLQVVEVSGVQPYRPAMSTPATYATNFTEAEVYVDIGDYAQIVVRITYGHRVEMARPFDTVAGRMAWDPTFTIAGTGGDTSKAFLTDTQIVAANKDGTAGTLSLRTLGAGALQAAPGNHVHTSFPNSLGLDTVSGGTSLDMRDQSAGADLKRSRFINVSNVTYFQAVNDAYTVPTFEGFRFDHSTGKLTITNLDVTSMGSIGGAAYETTITGNGSTTLFTLNHNLGTRNVVVTVRQNASPWEHVNAKVKSVSTSSVTVEASPALAGGVVYDVMVARALGGATAAVSSPSAHASSHLAAGSDPLIIPYVSSLPGSPVDGQEIYYLADAANGVAWHLKYRSAEGGSYKWYYVGGAPLQNAIATAGNTSSTAFVDLNGGLPAVTLPLAGDYDFDFTARLINQSSAAPQWVMLCAPKFGGATTADPDAGMADKSSALGINGEQFTVGRSKLRKTGLAAGIVVKLQYRQSVAVSCDWQDRHIAATPVRVG